MNMTIQKMRAILIEQGLPDSFIAEFDELEKRIHAEHTEKLEDIIWRTEKRVWEEAMAIVMLWGRVSNPEFLERNILEDFNRMLASITNKE